MVGWLAECNLYVLLGKKSSTRRNGKNGSQASPARQDAPPHDQGSAGGSMGGAGSYGGQGNQDNFKLRNIFLSVLWFSSVIEFKDLYFKSVGN